MILYIVRRFINYAILTMIATVLAYMMASVMLNPSARYYGKNPRPSDDTVNRILTGLGVNPHTPLIERTWTWFTQIIFHGNFGQAVDATTVQHQILVRSGVSLKLLLAGSLIGALLGVALGVWGAVKQYKMSDQLVTYWSFLVLATPVFVIGVLLMIVTTWINNTTGHQIISFTGEYTPTVEGTWPVIWDRLGHLLLPTIALSMLGAAEYSRYQRNAMLDVLSADYIRTARSKGRTRNSALIRHGVRVALIPMSTYFAYSFGTLIAGSTFLEKIFSWHGMGEFALDAIVKNDINATAGSIFYVAVLLLISSTLAEVMYAALDPRVRI